jgi:hypothetical protein
MTSNVSLSIPGDTGKLTAEAEATSIHTSLADVIPSQANKMRTLNNRISTTT